MASKNRMERYVAHFTVPAIRPGWRGVVDAARAALRRKPVPVVPAPMVVEFWASAPVGVRMETRINRATVNKAPVAVEPARRNA